MDAGGLYTGNDTDIKKRRPDSLRSKNLHSKFLSGPTTITAISYKNGGLL